MSFQINNCFDADCEKTVENPTKKCGSESHHLNTTFILFDKFFNKMFYRSRDRCLFREPRLIQFTLSIHRSLLPSFDHPNPIISPSLQFYDYSCSSYNTNVDSYLHFSNRWPSRCAHTSTREYSALLTGTLTAILDRSRLVRRSTKLVSCVNHSTRHRDRARARWAPASATSLSLSFHSFINRRRRRDEIYGMRNNRTLQ